MNTYVYIIGMFLITLCIRVLPLVIFRKSIKNRFLRSFFYYVPYVTLSVMTFPAIVNATQSPIAGSIALILAIIAAWLRLNMMTVSAICCITVFVVELFV